MGKLRLMSVSGCWGSERLQFYWLAGYCQLTLPSSDYWQIEGRVEGEENPHREGHIYYHRFYGLRIDPGPRRIINLKREKKTRKNKGEMLKCMGANSMGEKNTETNSGANNPRRIGGN